LPRRRGSSAAWTPSRGAGAGRGDRSSVSGDRQWYSLYRALLPVIFRLQNINRSYRKCSVLGKVLVSDRKKIRVELLSLFSKQSDDPDIFLPIATSCSTAIKILIAIHVTEYN
jgi:hypothetical protein